MTRRHVPESQVARWIGEILAGKTLSQIAQAEGYTYRNALKVLTARGYPSTKDALKAYLDGERKGPIRKVKVKVPKVKAPKKRYRAEPVPKVRERLPHVGWPTPVSFVFDLGRGMR